MSFNSEIIINKIISEIIPFYDYNIKQIYRLTLPSIYDGTYYS